VERQFVCRPRRMACSAVATAVLVSVLATCQPGIPSGITRTYYIAADEVEWDYAPSGRNLITGREFGEEENHWMASGPTRIPPSRP